MNERERQAHLFAYGADDLPNLKPCPVCGGQGKMRYGEMPLAECQDAQCGFITSHYYWQNIAVLVQQTRTQRGG